MAMSSFEYRDGELYAEDIPLAQIAEQYGTPTYVYSHAAFIEAYRAFDNAFARHPHLVCYSVKANSNIAILEMLARLGSGFDIVSGGELARVLKAGGDPERVVFSGVGKQRWELTMALEAGIGCFNVESEAEMTLLASIAVSKNVVAPISIRVNPDVDARTHPYIATGLQENKFGVDRTTASELYHRAAATDGLRIVGIDCHIGSQLTELGPIIDAMERVLELVDELGASGIVLEHIDLGGGLGVRYHDEDPLHVDTYAGAILQTLGNRPQKLLFEPGRFIAAEAGVLLSQVQLVKRNGERHFAVVDAAMNDLMRPSLYNAWRKVSEVNPGGGSRQNYSVVGPVCETGDFLARDRELCLAAGDLITIHTAGAYGFVMSSNYNTRGRPAEILVSRDRSFCIRKRETIEDLLALESPLPAYLY
jgi:diaminopimelate decarboxylase